MEVLALIPARGGSKSIKRKNLLPLAGKPLVAYSIEHALAAKQVTEVSVSTDDIEIWQVGINYGATMIQRPPELATDTSPDIDTFYHALAYLRDFDEHLPDCVVHLRPTCPIRRVGDIDAAIDLLMAHPEATSVRSVSVAKQSPYKMWRSAGDYIEPIYSDDVKHLVYTAKSGNTHGKPLWAPYHGEQHSQPRQTLEQVYHQNGYIDVIRTSTILERVQMAGERVIPFVCDFKIYEIDYPEQIAETEDALSIGITAIYEKVRHAV